MRWYDRTIGGRRGGAWERGWRHSGPRRRARFVALYDRAVEELWPVPSDELDIATSFGTTRVRRYGAGDRAPLVLLHGNSGTSVGWCTIVEPLARDHVVLAVDVIGTLGRSVQTRPLDRAAGLALWFRALMDGLGVDRAHVVGFSEGGFVAFQVALGNADRLASMVAIDAAGTVERIRPRFLGSLAWTVLKILLRVPDAMRDFGQRMIPGVELPELQWELMTAGARQFRTGLPMPTRASDDDLRRLTVPTLLYMAGASEVYDPVKAAARARHLMPDVEIVIVEGAPHGLPLTEPERTWGDILDFVVRQEPAPTGT
jgi:pimeloyl-ACP methyl ester carboxylesterase